MGVYSTRKEQEFETGLIECAYEPGIEAALHIVAESEMNYNAIMQAIGIHELAVLESTGQEMIYEATDIKAFGGKIKKFLLNIWEKIKGVFKKFFAMLNSYIKTDKEFIDKYKKDLVQIDTKDFEYKGFKFDNLDFNLDKLSNDIAGIYEPKLSSELDSDTKSDIINKMRGEFINSSLDSSEMTKELFKFFRSGEDSKITLDKISTLNEIRHIESNSELKKNAEKSYSDLEKIIKAAIRDVDKEMNEAIKTTSSDNNNTAEVKKLSNHSALLKEEMNILQLVNGAKLTAIKDQNRQAKSICVKLLTYKPKNASYSFVDSVEESFLSGVILK